MGNNIEIKEKLISSSIPIRISGEDTNGQRFVESMQGFVVRRNGAVLDTHQALAEGNVLEITNMLTNQKALARVRSLGPALGERVRLLVEIEDSEHFWSATVPPGVDRRSRNGGGSVLSTAARKQPMPVSELPLTSHDRLTEVLHELVRNAVEAILQPTVEPLIRAVQEEILQAKNTALANIQEQIPIATTALSERLEDQLIKAVTKGERTLEAKQLMLLSSVEEKVKSQQREFGDRLEGTLDFAQERWKQETDDRARKALVCVRQSIEEESALQEKRFVERCQALSNDLVDPYVTIARQKLSVWAEQTEVDLKARITKQSDEIANAWTAGLKARCEQTMAETSVSMENLFNGIQGNVSERAQQLESALAGRLALRTDEIAAQFSSQLENSSREVLAGYTGQIREHLIEVTAGYRKSFLEQVETELKHRREQIIQQAQEFFQQSTDANLTRLHKEIRGLMKELGEAMVKQADIVSKPKKLTSD